MGEEDRNAFISRIGTFFILLGVLGIILFIASDMGDSTTFGYFFVAIMLLAAGWVFKRMTAQPPAANKRFEGIRKLQQNQREAKAKKEAAKNAKSKK